jgi:hypothetical protein
VVRVPGSSASNTHLQSGFSHACLKPLLGCLCNGAGHFPFAGVEFEAIVLPAMLIRMLNQVQNLICSRAFMYTRTRKLKLSLLFPQAAKLAPAHTKPVGTIDIPYNLTY